MPIDGLCECSQVSSHSTDTVAIYFSVLYPIHGFVGDNMCFHSFILCKIISFSRLLLCVMRKELLKRESQTL